MSTFERDNRGERRSRSRSYGPGSRRRGPVGQHRERAQPIRREPKPGEREKAVEKRRAPLRLLLASEQGEFFEHPKLEPLPTRAGERLPADLGGPDLFKASPSGSHLVALRRYRPVGWDPERQCRVQLTKIERKGQEREVWAVGAALPPDWLCLRAPTGEGGRGIPDEHLPACCEVAAREGAVLVAASNLQSLSRGDPLAYDTPDLLSRVQRRLAATPGNRVLRRLAHCALEYSCRMAQNFFYKRGEIFLSVSGGCATGRRRCSAFHPPQNGGSVNDSSHARSRVEDLVDVGAEHLREARGGTVTFGLGAGGDQQLSYERIERSILMLRAHAPDARLNLDTQIGLPSSIGRLFNAGLFSVRIGLNSAVQDHYERCYGSVGATFENLRGALGVARGKGGRIFLGLEVVPGFSDRPSELEALLRLIAEFGVDGVQLRTGGGSPEEPSVAVSGERAALGIGELVRQLKSRAPGLWLGTGDLPVPLTGAASERRPRPERSPHPIRSR